MVGGIGESQYFGVVLGRGWMARSRVGFSLETYFCPGFARLAAAEEPLLLQRKVAKLKVFVRFCRGVEEKTSLRRVKMQKTPDDANIRLGLLCGGP